MQARKTRTIISSSDFQFQLRSLFSDADDSCSIFILTGGLLCAFENMQTKNKNVVFHAVRVRG